MADKISTAGTRIAAAAAGVAGQMAGGSTTAQASTVAQILNVLSKRPDLMNQVLRLIPLSVNSGAGSIKPE